MSPSRGLLVCAALGCATVATSGDAAARLRAPPREVETRVAFLPERLVGELPPSAGADVRSALRELIDGEGVSVVPDDPLETDAAGECDAPCRREFARSASATFLLRAEVVSDEDEFSVTLTLFDGSTGEPVATFADECSVCGFVEVQRMVRLRGLDARVEIGKRQTAPTPEPGPEPAPPAPVTLPAPRPWMPATGWALIGSGAAATIGGVILASLHHQSAGCRPNPRGGECIPLRYTTAVPGVALLGAGVATAAVGTILVVLARRAAKKRRGRTSRRAPLRRIAATPP
ncbi:MAG: hypothetical protein AAF721_31465 [Myxococcota bacterium]